MSRRSTWVLATTLALVALPASVRGQTNAELQQRIDSLTPLRDEALRVSKAAHQREMERRRREEGLATDTLMVGPLRVVTLRGQEDRARELIGEVWEQEYAPFLDRPARADVEIFTFAWPNASEVIPIEGAEAPRRIELRRWRSRGAVKNAVRQQIAAMLGAELQGTQVGSWIRGPIRVPDEPAELYRKTAIAGALSTRECLEGVAMRCWDALSADLLDDPYPLATWYSAEERVANGQLALDRRLMLARGQETEADACRDGSVEACDALLGRGVAQFGVVGPLEAVGPKAFLVWIALNEGGTGAWARLTADPDMSPGDALRAASGLSAEALAARWQARVVESRVLPMGVFDRSVLLALVWAGIFATFATRSTRWRLG